MPVDAHLTAVIGMRGMGKSQHLAQWIAKRKPPRLAIWDIKREHGAGTDDLGEAIRRMQQQRWRIVFHPDTADDKRRIKQFDLFCRALYAAGRCTAAVEELAFVTKPNMAPAGWRTLSLLGRARNSTGGGQVDVIATCQRPASVDKDFLGNCSVIRSYRLGWATDAEIVAKSLRVEPDELMGLAPLHYVERGESDTQARRGVLKISGVVAVKKPALGQQPKAEKLHVHQDCEKDQGHRHNT